MIVVGALSVQSLSTPGVEVATTYAIHKPRNVLSATGGVALDGSRRNLTDVMLAAGVEPLPGHVGRLDAETSGLILVTSDSLLLRAVLGWTDVLEEFGGSPISKQYELLLAGRYEPSSPELQRLGEPLTHERGGDTYHSEAALEVEFLEAFQDDELAAGGYALIDRADPSETLAAERRKLRDSLKPVRSRSTGELMPAWVYADGWCTRVKLTLQQGRHHQIRRLCQRAGLRLRHLRRVSIGNITLDGMSPGDVRTLTDAEVEALRLRCLPLHDEAACAM